MSNSITKQLKIFTVEANGVSEIVATQKQGDKLVETLSKFGVTAVVKSELHNVTMQVGDVVVKQKA